MFVEEWNKIKRKYESSRMIDNTFVKKFAKYGEGIYLVTIAVAILQWGVLTTMIREVNGLSPIIAWVDFGVITLLWIKILFGYAKDFNKLMLVMTVLLIAQSITNMTNDGKIMLITLLILAAYEVKFDNIVKVYVISVLLLLSVAFGLAEIGIIKNLKYYVWGRGFRYALGGVYPTDTMCHFMFLVLAILYLIRNRVRVWLLVVLGIASYGMFYLTKAKTSWMCIMLVLTGFCVISFSNKIGRYKKNNIHLLAVILKKVLIWSMPLGALFFSMVVSIYMRWNRFRTYFPDTIASRIGMTAKAFRMYGVPLWGCPIQMVGNGGKENRPNGYFFIDCSYMWVLFVYGLIVVAIILAIFVAIGYKFQNDWYMLIILFTIALDCTIEHHLIDFSYNIFMVALLADCGINKYLLKKKAATE